MDTGAAKSLVRILVVEDQNMFRATVKRELNDQYPGCQITEARTLSELLEVGDDPASFQLAVVDLELPDGTALEWITETAKRPDAPPIIILSSVDAKQEFIVFRAASAGIPGFVHKNDDMAVFHEAVRVVMAGGVFFSPTVQQMRRKMQANPSFFNKILSDREQEILRHIGEGCSNEEVAEAVGLRVSSVVEYRKRIMMKLDIHKDRDLLRYAIEKGFSQL
jgi:DNA-binding NarL/FixJ family response regulator